MDVYTIELDSSTGNIETLYSVLCKLYADYGYTKLGVECENMVYNATYTVSPSYLNSQEELHQVGGNNFASTLNTRIEFIKNSYGLNIWGRAVNLNFKFYKAHRYT